ncbi:MAG TPA: hypothetical protein PK957_02135 [Candidatus Dojkabacteria bacterium]|nr:hypothetical protein [Candidatus Dojkabacteria bacterium]HQF37112.1 hypothetical protein [Candidatus Dojkabacteria bacterium]
MISLLGAKNKLYGQIFNIALFIYGILGLVVPLRIVLINEIDLSLKIILVSSLIVCCLGTMIVSLFPTDIFEKFHRVCGFILFGGVFITGISSMIFMYLAFSNWILFLILCVWIVIVGIDLYLHLNGKKGIESCLSFFEWRAFFS